MARTMDYHCPNCGGALAFDAGLQKLKCPYCDSAFLPEEFQDKDEVLTDDNQQEPAPGADVQAGSQEVDGHTLSFGGNAQWGEESGEDMRVYACRNCGAQVIADATTAASHCPYCGNVVVMTGQLSGDFKPDCLVPFQVDKDQAVAEFKNYIRKAKYVPKVFSAQDHPEEIKGVYVPFWLFDADADAKAQFQAENVRTWSDRNYKYIETEYYELYREGVIAMRKVPVDGSKKMTDALMESIEPFDFSKAVPFQTAYLAGFLADRYDVGYAECTDRANERMYESAMGTLRDTAVGYTSVRQTGGTCEWKNANITYALYPVWLLSTSWQGENYLFAMNGQTGKFVGDLPLDQKAFFRHRILVSVILALIIFVVIMLALSMY